MQNRNNSDCCAMPPVSKRDDYARACEAKALRLTAMSGGLRDRLFGKAPSALTKGASPSNDFEGFGSFSG